MRTEFLEQRFETPVKRGGGGGDGGSEGGKRWRKEMEEADGGRGKGVAKE